MKRALIEYLGTLVLVGGDHDGAPFTVLPWESRFVRGAFGQPDDAALSVARGNGKSALVAGIAAAVVDPAGPLHGTRREVVCVARKLDQARIVFEDVLAFMGQRYDLRDRAVWRKQDSANRATLEHLPSGARVRCIGADPDGAHGLRPWLVLADEPARWPPAQSERMLAALRTALGKVPGSRLIALGTRPASPSHWFARMLAGGCGYAQTHAAKPDDAPGQRRTWRKANPSLDHLPSLAKRIETEWAEAKRDPAVLAEFRGLRLNLGVSETVESLLLDADTWAAAEGDAERRGRYVLGIDLGGTEAMSAGAACWPDTGRLEVWAMLPGNPSLAERGLRDGVGALYEAMQARGELGTTHGRTVPVEALLSALVARWGNPARIVADRYREGEVLDGLEAARVPVVPVEFRGQGFRDGSEDVRRFRSSVLTGLVTPAESLLLRSAMAEARTVSDPAGNEKLSKASEGGRRKRARDDAAAAAILAVASANREPLPAPVRRFTGSQLAG